MVSIDDDWIKNFQKKMDHQMVKCFQFKTDSSMIRLSDSSDQNDDTIVEIKILQVSYSFFEKKITFFSK